jgi:hypothetical protein
MMIDCPPYALTAATFDAMSQGDRPVRNSSGAATNWRPGHRGSERPRYELGGIFGWGLIRALTINIINKLFLATTMAQQSARTFVPMCHAAAHCRDGTAEGAVTTTNLFITSSLHACTHAWTPAHRNARTQECGQELVMKCLVVYVVTMPSTVPSLQWAAAWHMGTNARALCCAMHGAKFALK